MNFIQKFIKNVANIYFEEEDIEASFGKEYAQRYGVFDPKTGKRIISVKKILTRVLAFAIFALVAFFLIRITMKGYW